MRNDYSKLYQKASECHSKHSQISHCSLYVKKKSQNIILKTKNKVKINYNKNSNHVQSQSLANSE